MRSSMRSALLVCGMCRCRRRPMRSGRRSKPRRKPAWLIPKPPACDKRPMHIINRIASFHDDMTAWRRDIHAHPETAFEEVRTAEVVAEKLKGFGVEVHKGLAGTGVVGTLRSGNGKRAIALRAD